MVKDSVIDIPDVLFKDICGKDMCCKDINIKETSNIIIYTYFKCLCETLIKSIPSDVYLRNVKTGSTLILQYNTISSNIILKFKILGDYISNDETKPAYQKYFDMHGKYPDLSKWSKPSLVNDIKIKATPKKSHLFKCSFDEKNKQMSASLEIIINNNVEHIILTFSQKIIDIFKEKYSTTMTPWTHIVCTDIVCRNTDIVCSNIKIYGQCASKQDYTSNPFESESSESPNIDMMSSSDDSTLSKDTIDDSSQSVQDTPE